MKAAAAATGSLSPVELAEADVAVESAELLGALLADVDSSVVSAVLVDSLLVVADAAVELVGVLEVVLDDFDDELHATVNNAHATATPDNRNARRARRA